ncbi:MAG: hypothetical protein GY941_28535 [Planctomycetes bacterium]|nr:hypothetical protein [Planctomycetota bacterium]
MASSKRLLCLVITALFLASCTGSSKYMRSSEVYLSPTEDMALIRFMRPSGYGHRANFNMLDGEKVIGNSVAKTWFEYPATPGRHLFIATGENKAFLEADISPGKTYYVLIRIYPGHWYARVTFVPVHRGSEFWDKVIEYESTLVKLEPDTEALQEWEDNNKEKIKKVIAGYETLWKDKKQWPKLGPHDGR